MGKKLFSYLSIVLALLGSLSKAQAYSQTGNCRDVDVFARLNHRLVPIQTATIKSYEAHFPQLTILNWDANEGYDKELNFVGWPLINGTADYAYSNDTQKKNDLVFKVTSSQSNCNVNDSECFSNAVRFNQVIIPSEQSTHIQNVLLNGSLQCFIWTRDPNALPVFHGKNEDKILHYADVYLFMDIYFNEEAYLKTTANGPVGSEPQYLGNVPFLTSIDGVNLPSRIEVGFGCAEGTCHIDDFKCFVIPVVQ